MYVHCTLNNIFYLIHYNGQNLGFLTITTSQKTFFIKYVHLRIHKNEYSIHFYTYPSIDILK